MFSSIQKFWHSTLQRPFKLAVYEAGQGQPLLLLHGIASNSKVWHPVVRILAAKGWRCVAPDLLGFGASPKPDWNSYSVQEHAKMVAALLRRKRLASPMVVVGHSMGCLVAVHLATQYPQYVQRLILYEPPLFVDDPLYQAHLKRRGKYFAFFEYIAARPELLLAEARTLWRLATRVVGFKLNRTEWIPFERSLRNTIMGQTAYKELGQLTVPTDIIHGRLDVVVIRTEIKQMFRHNPHITLHLLNNMHGISPRSARYIAKLITAEPSDTPTRPTY